MRAFSVIPIALCFLSGNLTQGETKAGGTKTDEAKAGEPFSVGTFVVAYVSEKSGRIIVREEFAPAGRLRLNVKWLALDIDGKQVPTRKSDMFPIHSAIQGELHAREYIFTEVKPELFPLIGKEMTVEIYSDDTWEPRKKIETIKLPVIKLPK